MAARAISGPTADQQPPFAWSRSPEALREVPHDGHPGGKGLGLGRRHLPNTMMHCQPTMELRHG